MQDVRLSVRGSLRLQPPSPCSASLDRQHPARLQVPSISDLKTSRKEANLKDEDSDRFHSKFEPGNAL